MALSDTDLGTLVAGFLGLSMDSTPFRGHISMRHVSWSMAATEMWGCFASLPHLTAQPSPHCLEWLVNGFSAP